MAKLHGRVRDLLHRGLSAFLLVVAVHIGGDARAQNSVAPDLEAMASALGSDDAGVRRDAIQSLRTLPVDALGAIAARLERLRRSRPSREEADAALTAFRRATGSRRADDLVDIADGVEAVLAVRRDAATLRMAEPLLLLRSLERMGSVEALRLVPVVFGLDGDVWRMESRRVTLRLGDRVAAAAIYARSLDGNPEARAWARWTSERLGLDAPGTLVQRLGPVELADVIEAYGATRTLSALPVVASFVDAEQRRVREAARGALRAYRQNGIWVARELFETRLGESADLRWSWERTLDELFARLDAARAEHVRAALAEASTALERGDRAGARQALDRALLRSPDLASREAAVLYARLADGGGDEASALFRRALAIAPDAPEAPFWQGRLEYAEARAALARGVLDVDAFVRAAELAPECLECVEVAERLRTDRAGPARDRTWPFAVAAALFAMLGLVLLVEAPSRSAPTGSATEEAPEEATEGGSASVAGGDDVLAALVGAATCPGEQPAPERSF